MRQQDETDKLMAIFLAGKRIIVPKAEVVRTSENAHSLFYVSKGYAKRYLINNDGYTDIQSLYGPGYYFPQIAIFRGLLQQEIYKGPEIYYYETISPSVLYSIDVETLAQAAVADPTIYKELLVIAGRRLQANIQQIENHALHNSYEQVAHQLVFLASEFGRQTSKGIKIEMPVTHQMIADMISVTRETVSQSMAKLSKAGLIIAGKFTTIPNMKKLEKIAYQYLH